jgi:hypothetical protein
VIAPFHHSCVELDTLIVLSIFYFAYLIIVGRVISSWPTHLTYNLEIFFIVIAYFAFSPTSHLFSPLLLTQSLAHMADKETNLFLMMKQLGIHHKINTWYLSCHNLIHSTIIAKGIFIIVNRGIHRNICFTSPTY